MKFCILTSKSSWLYKNKIRELKKLFNKDLKMFTDHRNVPKSFKYCFVISYYKIIPKKFLKKATKFLVNHESDLPENRGFSPLYWQILKGETKIISTLFEINSEKVDTGKFLLKKNYKFNKSLLYNEIKNEQFANAIDMIKSFLSKSKINVRNSRKKNIKKNFLKLRKPNDSKLNIFKSIKSQFNLLRICDNEKFPAYFDLYNNRYVIKIYKKK